MQPKYVVIMLILLAFVLSTVGAMAQSPNRDTLRVGGCVPGETYDPACDVDHDGDVDDRHGGRRCAALIQQLTFLVLQMPLLSSPEIC